MPSVPRPMKATAGPLPPGDDWLYEIKWDGMRLIVSVTDGSVRLTSANGRDVTVSYPELARLGESLGVSDAVLDGEVVVFDDAGRPDFGRLQHRMHVTNPRQALERSADHPVVLCLFDLLRLEGHDLYDVPLSERRRLLTSLVDAGAHWQVPAAFTDGEALFEAAVERGLEGVVAKRPASTYRPGARTSEWVKVKVRLRQEFVVGGWAAGTGARSSTIGGLLLGYHPVDDSGVPAAHLRYAGRVGSGLSDSELRVLERSFDELATDDCPFEPAPPLPSTAAVRWLRPTTVVEVAFAEWTSEGLLRHPTYAGRRDDVDPETVTADG